MSLENRKRQYKMFMDRGETALAEEQVKGHPECKESNIPTPSVSETKSNNQKVIKGKK